jgi:hypothetical protein
MHDIVSMSSHTVFQPQGQKKCDLEVAEIKKVYILF